MFALLEPKLKVQICDRNGKFIAKLTVNSTVWDGINNGERLLATDYWFKVSRENGKVHLGHFALKR